MLGVIDPWYERNVLSLLSLSPHVLCQVLSTLASSSFPAPCITIKSREALTYQRLLEQYSLSVTTKSNCMSFWIQQWCNNRKLLTCQTKYVFCLGTVWKLLQREEVLGKVEGNVCRTGQQGKVSSFFLSDLFLLREIYCPKLLLSLGFQGLG